MRNTVVHCLKMDHAESHESPWAQLSCVDIDAFEYAGSCVALKSSPLDAGQTLVQSRTHLGFDCIKVTLSLAATFYEDEEAVGQPQIRKPWHRIALSEANQPFKGRHVQLNPHLSQQQQAQSEPTRQSIRSNVNAK